MSDIDWSEAPADAEYAGTCTGDQEQVFYKNVRENSYDFIYLYEATWDTNDGRPHCQPLIPRPVNNLEWSGEGLPPIGEVCESMWNESAGEWLKVKVFGVNEHSQPIFRWEEGPKKYEYQASPASGFHGRSYFRPIKTPEQMAAEARQLAIDEMVNEMRKARYDRPKTDIAPVDMASHYAAGLYDAGYRRVTPWND